MLCKEIITIIEDVFLKGAALSFDNVGLLAGRANKEVNRIYIALDATESVILQAKEAKADMLITHHPLVFSPMKRVTDEEFTSRRVLSLIQSDISYYAMHTNYDVLRMGTLLEERLEISDTEVLDITAEINGISAGIGKVGTLSKAMTFKECCLHVKNKLELESVKVWGNMEAVVSRVAVSGGSGKSAISPAVEKSAEVLVTGDIGHHEGLDALEQNLFIIDAGHYGTEYMFIDDMKQFLQKNIPSLEMITAPVVHPFQVL